MPIQSLGEVRIRTTIPAGNNDTRGVRGRGRARGGSALPFAPAVAVARWLNLTAARAEHGVLVMPRLACGPARAAVP